MTGFYKFIRASRDEKGEVRAHFLSSDLNGNLARNLADLVVGQHESVMGTPSSRKEFGRAEKEVRALMSLEEQSDGDLEAESILEYLHYMLKAPQRALDSVMNRQFIQQFRGASDDLDL